VRLPADLRHAVLKAAGHPVGHRDALLVAVLGHAQPDGGRHATHELKRAHHQAHGYGIELRPSGSSEGQQEGRTDQETD